MGEGAPDASLLVSGVPLLDAGGAIVAPGLRLRALAPVHLGHARDLARVDALPVGAVDGRGHGQVLARRRLLVDPARRPRLPGQRGDQRVQLHALAGDVALRPRVGLAGARARGARGVRDPAVRRGGRRGAAGGQRDPARRRGRPRGRDARGVHGHGAGGGPAHARRPAPGGVGDGGRPVGVGAAVGGARGRRHARARDHQPGALRRDRAGHRDAAGEVRVVPVRGRVRAGLPVRALRAPDGRDGVRRRVHRVRGRLAGDVQRAPGLGVRRRGAAAGRRDPRSGSGWTTSRAPTSPTRGATCGSGCTARARCTPTRPC